jgi:membrane protein implicated in regulation of membrane protease activity
MVGKKTVLFIFFVIAFAVGIFGLLVSILFSSFQFLLYSLPNLSLAVFFGYKYFRGEKNRVRDVNENGKKERQIK